MSRGSLPGAKAGIIPKGYDWAALLQKDGEALETQYRATLEHLSRQSGMLGEIFKKARPDIQNPATLKRLIVDLIEPESWLAMDADVKGDIYEGLLAKSAAESPKGAGQYFTPRELIKAIVDAMQPGPEDTVCDPACGTGGFLLAAHAYVTNRYGRKLDPDQKKHLRSRDGACTGDGAPRDHEPAAARRGRRSLPDCLGRGQPGCRPRKALLDGPDESAVRQEEFDLDRQRGRRAGEGGHGLRATGLLDHHQEQAAQLPPAREDAAQGERALRDGGPG
jgi:hypothetical protein